MQLHNSSSPAEKLECPRSPGVLHGLATGAVKRVWCKQWSCEVCSIWLAHYFRIRVLQVQPTLFITFHAGLLPSREHAFWYHQRVREFWRWWRENIDPEMYDWARKDEVGTEPRDGLAGKLHVHTLIRSVNYLSVKQLRVAVKAAQAIFHCSYPLRIEPVEDEYKASWYVTKYMTKDDGDYRWWSYAHPRFASTPARPKRQGFEPQHFIRIENYVGASYVPYPARRSALPYSSSQRELAPEWGQMVADCVLGTAQPILTPNCSSLLSLFLIERIRGTRENVK